MDRHTAGGALKAGVAGTVVLSLLLLFVEAQTRSRVRAGEVIAQYVGLPNQPLVATAVFVFLTAIVWPFVFLVLEGRELLPGRTRLRRLVLFTGTLAVAFAATGYGGLSGPVLILYGVGVLVAHIAYGFTLARLLDPAGTNTNGAAGTSGGP